MGCKKEDLTRVVEAGLKYLASGTVFLVYPYALNDFIDLSVLSKEEVHHNYIYYLGSPNEEELECINAFLNANDPSKLLRFKIDAF